MSRSVILIIVCLMTLSTCFNNIFANDSNGKSRAGLLNSETYSLVDNGNKEKKDLYSILTIGSMFGGLYSWSDLNDYEVINNKFVLVDELEKFSFTTYIFPSICLWGNDKFSFSAIIPVTLASTNQVSTGFGISFGLNKVGNYEVGFAIVGVSFQQEKLNTLQNNIFKNNLEISDGISNVIENKTHFGISFGIYIAPTID